MYTPLYYFCICCRRPWRSRRRWRRRPRPRRRLLHHPTQPHPPPQLLLRYTNMNDKLVLFNIQYSLLQGKYFEILTLDHLFFMDQTGWLLFLIFQPSRNNWELLFFLPQTVEAVVPMEAELETEEEPEVGTRKSVKRFRDPRRQFIITSDKNQTIFIF